MFIELVKSIMYDTTVPIIGEAEVKAIMNVQLEKRLHANSIVILSDSKYTTITAQKVSDIYVKSDMKSFRYRDEVNDCDDASLLFKSELVKSAGNDWSVKYPFAAGIVYGYIPTPHAINWFITPDKVIMFIEPQTGEIFKPKGDRIFFLYS